MIDAFFEGLADSFLSITLKSSLVEITGNFFFAILKSDIFVVEAELRLDGKLRKANIRKNLTIKKKSSVTRYIFVVSDH